MNNEEKILEVLNQHTQMFAQMQQNMEKMQGQLDQHTQMFQKMDERMSGLENRMNQVEKDTHFTRILVEQDVDKKLQQLAEGDEAIMHQLDELTPKSRTEKLEGEFEMMKLAVRLLSEDVAELKAGA